MNVAVRYYTMTGNTTKLAEAVAEAAGVQAQTIEEPLTEKVDVLFLGSAVYATGVSKEIKEYIKNNSDKIGMIVNISSAALLSSTYKQVTKVAKANGVKMCEKEFHCRGKFQNVHKDKPDSADLENAKAFTREIMGA